MMLREAVLVFTRASKMAQNEFDKVLLGSIEEGLKSVLGEAAAEMILLHFERSKGLEREKIPRRIEFFADVLRCVLGISSILVGNFIVRTLCSKLGLQFQNKEGYDFAAYTEDVRNNFVASEGRNRSAEER